MDPAELTLAECTAAIERLELTPTELTEACLARIERLEPRIEAFVTIDSSGAMAAASTLQEELARGHRRGPLHGIPVAIKDLIDVAGLPTTASSRVLRGNVAGRDAPVVARLRAEGSIVLGKTNTQEFAYGVVSAPTRNPWDTVRIPGGSSGGSAAAVAAGMCPGALGTDTAGSVRIPSALCGITGLRPRRDVVSLEGIVPLSWTLDSCGPITRTAEDAQLMWQGMTGAAPSVPVMKDLSVGVTDLQEDFLDLDAEIEAAVGAGMDEMERAGARLERVRLPAFEQWASSGGILGKLLASEAAAAHQQAGWLDRRDDYTQETLTALDYGAKLLATDVALARRRLDMLKSEWLDAIEGVDVLLLPTTPVPAPLVSEVEEPQSGHGHRPPIAGLLTRICGPVNYCDLAAVSVPCGFSSRGLPIGMQFVGRDETTVLGAALGWQRLADWHLQRPPMAATATG